jgi:uncharacterized lipoprotein YmbA
MRNIYLSLIMLVTFSGCAVPHQQNSYITIGQCQDAIARAKQGGFLSRLESDSQSTNLVEIGDGLFKFNTVECAQNIKDAILTQ